VFSVNYLSFKPEYFLAGDSLFLIFFRKAILSLLGCQLTALVQECSDDELFSKTAMFFHYYPSAVATHTGSTKFCTPQATCRARVAGCSFL